MGTAGVALTALGLSAISPIIVIPLLRLRGVIDIPGRRSSHDKPTLRGVGISVGMGVFGGWMVYAATSTDAAPTPAAIVFGAALAVAVIGLVEDVRGLPIGVRLVGQLLVGVGLAMMCALHEPSHWWLVPVLAFGFAGYVNAANFMDGIDSISALHGMVAGGYYWLIGSLTGAAWLEIPGTVTAAAFAGFLPWNVVRRVRVFLGDVGSYLLGGLVAGCAAIALVGGLGLLLCVAPLVVYVADTASTLALRAVRGEKLTEAHRTHTYQRLISVGWSHLASAAVVAAATAVCCVLALMNDQGRLTTPLALICVGSVICVYLALPHIVQRGRRQVAA